VQRLRSQAVILKRGQHLKYLPFILTEHGAIMAATVLNSPHAVQMSVLAVRAFVRMRAALTETRELARQIEELERKYDAQFKIVFDAIRQLMTPPGKGRRSIGFRVEEAGPTYRVSRMRRQRRQKQIIKA